MIRPKAVSPPRIAGSADTWGFFMRTAFLVDGGFYVRRMQRLLGPQEPERAARRLLAMCLSHLKRVERDKETPYRIFYYDCPPLNSSE